MNEEERKQYKKETGKSPNYKDQPTDDYKKWLNHKDMQKAIQRVINFEKNNDVNEI